MFRRSFKTTIQIWYFLPAIRSNENIVRVPGILEMIEIIGIHSVFHVVHY